MMPRSLTSATIEVTTVPCGQPHRAATIGQNEVPRPKALLGPLPFATSGGEKCRWGSSFQSSVDARIPDKSRTLGGLAGELLDCRLHGSWPRFPQNSRLVVFNRPISRMEAFGEPGCAPSFLVRHWCVQEGEGRSPARTLAVRPAAGLHASRDSLYRTASDG